MKKLLTTALIMIVTAVCANAQTVTSAEVKASVAKQLQAGYTKIAKGDVEVKITATPFASIQLPDGKVTYKITQGGDKIIPRDIKRVDVYVNDAFVRTLNLPCQTIVYKDVLVAADFITGNRRLQEKRLLLKE